MDTKTGKDLFSMINRRAMQISRDQGATKGLAKGSKLQAAREVFAINGSPGGDFEAWWGEVHKHGTSVSTNPDTVRRRIKRHKLAAKQQTEQNNVSPALVDRYISYIKEHHGKVPLDWVLLREWTDATSTDLRHARKVIIARGYRLTNKSGGYYSFQPPEPPVSSELNGRPQSASAAPIQQTLALDPDSSVAVLSDIAAKLDQVISELRQLRGITAEVWK